jgi:hypothetical protein
MRKSGGNGRNSVSQANSIISNPHGEPTARWNQARQRYADLWSGAVRQDWFSVYVYASSDSEFLREIDFAAEEPEIAKTIAEARGGVHPNPQDLLISLGWRMGNRNEPNDPETWAAIDAGQFVCFTHFGTADRRMGWEQKSLLLAAAATVVMMAHPQGRLMTYPHIDAASAETTNIPKVNLLTNYLLSAAASECYLDDGPMQDPKLLLARLCEDHEVTWHTMEAIASIAMEKPADWCEGPMETVEIAHKTTELLVEAYRQVVLPDIAPVTHRTESPPQIQPARRSAA